MTKTLSSRIAERTGLKNPVRGATNRAAFLAVRLDVEHALNDGWPVKTIWETLFEEGKITCSYQAFRGYVNRLILSSTDSPKNKKPASLDSVSIEPEQTNEPKQPVEEQTNPPLLHGLPGFVFNPTPNKEDLI